MATLDTAQGKVYCGCIGSMDRHEYGVVGKSVNLAARLMMKAAGMILCDDSTKDLDGLHSFDCLSSVEAKGYGNLVPVFTPLTYRDFFVDTDQAMSSIPSHAVQFPPCHFPCSCLTFCFLGLLLVQTRLENCCHHQTSQCCKIALRSFRASLILLATAEQPTTQQSLW